MATPITSQDPNTQYLLPDSNNVYAMNALENLYSQGAFKNLGYSGPYFQAYGGGATDAESGQGPQNNGSYIDPKFLSYLQSQGLQIKQSPGSGGGSFLGGNGTPTQYQLVDSSGAPVGGQSTWSGGTSLGTMMTPIAIAAGVGALQAAGAAGAAGGSGAAAGGTGGAGGVSGMDLAADAGATGANSIGGAAAAYDAAAAGGIAPLANTLTPMASPAVTPLASLDASGTLPAGLASMAPAAGAAGSAAAGDFASQLGQFVAKNPQLAAMLTGSVISALKGNPSNSTTSGVNTGASNQSNLIANSTPMIGGTSQRQYNAPPASYRPGFDPVWNYFTGGIGTLSPTTTAPAQGKMTTMPVTTQPSN